MKLINAETISDYIKREINPYGRPFKGTVYEFGLKKYLENASADYDVDKVAELLEKQIPKKPNYEGDGYYNGQPVYDTWICPCCEEMYEVDYDEYDYCPNCGQKIDWSDENETN